MDKAGLDRVRSAIFAEVGQPNPRPWFEISPVLDETERSRYLVVKMEPTVQWYRVVLCLQRAHLIDTLDRVDDGPRLVLCGMSSDTIEFPQAVAEDDENGTPAPIRIPLQILMFDDRSEDRPLLVEAPACETAEECQPSPDETTAELPVDLLAPAYDQV